MSTELEPEALRALDAVGITPAAWALHIFETEEWHGDACGCPYAHCAGEHHDVDEPCYCLPEMLAG